MRLDNYLQAKKYLPTREKAKDAIKNSQVKVNGEVCTKPAKQVSQTDKILVSDQKRYVSRAAYKLLEALSYFKLSPKDKNCLDIGSSTGGFTQVLLDMKAKTVTAVDVGTNQMDPNLRKNPNIDLHEQTDIRDFNLHKEYEFITVDVSFIPLKTILPEIRRAAKLSTEILLLYKPQFNVGQSNLKKGIVKLEEINSFISAFKKDLCNNNLGTKAVKKLTIKGKKGNIEYFIYCKKTKE